MLQWRDYSHELALDEMLWLEGHSLYAESPCGFFLLSCLLLHGLLWQPAFLSRMYCFNAFMQSISCYRGQPPIHFCITQSSDSAPSQHWNNKFFEHVTLKSLGLCIQLGHCPGATCINPKQSSNDDFVLIDCNGIHEVALDYCACEGAKSAEVQLLWSSLYPVTSMNPKSTTMFHLMKFFHILSFESKCLGYDSTTHFLAVPIT